MNRNVHYPCYLYSVMDYGRGLVLSFFTKELMKSTDVVVLTDKIPRDEVLDGTVACYTHTVTGEPVEVWVTADPLKLH